MTARTGPAVVVTTTLPDQASALNLARALVDSRLAACVHVTALTSVYRWRGSTETAPEWSCQIKTTPARAEEVMEQVKRLHSYEVPEILVVPVIDGSPAYLAWVAESVRDS